GGGGDNQLVSDLQRGGIDSWICPCDGGRGHAELPAKSGEVVASDHDVFARGGRFRLRRGRGGRGRDGGGRCGRHLLEIGGAGSGIGRIKVGLVQRRQHGVIGWLGGPGARLILLFAALDEKAAEENQMNGHNDVGDAQVRFALGLLLEERALGNERVRIIHDLYGRR